jgi:hypothetical protein
MTPGRKELKSPQSARMAGSSMMGKSSAKKKGGEIRELKFKTVDDIMYDHMKFEGCTISQVHFDIHGHNFTQKAAHYISKMLSSVFRVDKLHLNLSISAITKEHIEGLIPGILSLTDLKELVLDLSRSKIETDAMEMLSIAISSLTMLKTLNISVEK